jgi:hypothetical protein
MYKKDVAFIYKQKKNLLFAITEEHGKIIIQNDFFYNSYQEIKSFFFINFEFDSSQMHQIENTEKIILKKSYVEIDKIIPILNIEKNIYQLLYILDNCILYKMNTKKIFKVIEIFFNNKNTDIKENEERCFYSLYKDIFIDLNLIENDSLNKKTIISILINLFPYDNNKINFVFNK